MKTLLFLISSTLINFSSRYLLPMLLLSHCLLGIIYLFYPQMLIGLIDIHIFLGLFTVVCLIFAFYRFVLQKGFKTPIIKKTVLLQRLIDTLFLLNLSLLVISGVLLFFIRYYPALLAEKSIYVITIHQYLALFFPSTFLLKYAILIKDKLKLLTIYLQEQ